MHENAKGFPKHIGKLLRDNFFTGLLVVIPIGVITWILLGAVGMLWRIQELLPEAWRPDNFITNHIAALGLKALFALVGALLLAFAVSALGWASKLYLGRTMLEIVAAVIERIPVVRSIYSALNQLLRTMASKGGQQFHRVVYVEYPRKGLWALAFVTGPAKGPAVPPNHLNIYVPTTPNPTSGFHLIVPESEVRESNLRVEEAFKTILSLGIAQTEVEPSETQRSLK